MLVVIPTEHKTVSVKPNLKKCNLSSNTKIDTIVQANRIWILGKQILGTEDGANLIACCLKHGNTNKWKTKKRINIQHAKANSNRSQCDTESPKYKSLKWNSEIMCASKDKNIKFWKRNYTVDNIKDKKGKENLIRR